MSFAIGQRVRTTVTAPAGWAGAYSAPAGTLGTIVNSVVGGTYGVLLDDDPDQTPASYTVAELRAA